MQTDRFLGPVFRHVEVKFPHRVVQVRLNGLMKLYFREYMNVY